LIDPDTAAPLRKTEPMSSDAHGVQTRTKATRQDWIDAALTALDTEPIDQIRILGLAGGMGVSRSSFYWYFDNPEELRNELLMLWEHNTTSIVERAGRKTETIVAACLGVFECWADHRLYRSVLDLSVREWGRRDAQIATRVADADRARLEALVEMFQRHEFDPVEAKVRARLLYHSQVGYYAVNTDEPISERLRLLPTYLVAMTGQHGTKAEIAAFRRLLTRRVNPDSNHPDLSPESQSPGRRRRSIRPDSRLRELR
jgi:AcrR family transcriptional regulator